MMFGKQHHQRRKARNGYTTPEEEDGKQHHLRET